MFKAFERVAYVTSLVATLVVFSIGCYSVIIGTPSAGKWISSAGQIATVAGVFQLEVSGLFQKLMDHYADETRFPYGPPSHITRQIIDDVDHPVRAWLRNTFFFNVSVGFWLIIGGTLIQIWGTWA